MTSKSTKSNAFELFNEGIDDIYQHLMVADYIRSQTTAVINCAYSNLLRDVIVKSVGNVDAYFSNIMFELLLDRQAIFSTKLASKGDNRLHFSLKELSEIVIDVQQDRLRSNLTLRRIIDKKLKLLAFQNQGIPNVISKQFGVSAFWELAQTNPLVHQLKGEHDVHKHYIQLIDRRNTVTHNNDRDLIAHGTKNTVSREFIDDGILVTKIIVGTFESEVVTKW